MTSKKQFVGLGIAAALVVLVRLMPVPESLTREGLTALGIFAAAIVMWITEVLPMSVTGLSMSMLMVLFSIYSITDAYRTFAGTAFFFVFATYAINACLVETTIPDRICAMFIRLTKNNSRLFVLGLMTAAALLSGIMSNMATCALITALAVKIIKINGDPKPGTSNLGKCLMIGIAFASGMGGFATPAGTPANVLAISILETNLGVTIRFLDWMIIGIPFALVAVAICAFSVTLVFKPEPLTPETIAYAEDLKQTLGPLTAKEKKALIIIGLEICFWIANTWVPALNTTLVAILAMAVMFLPGIKVLDWKTYNKHANYDSLFMMGAITALVGGLTASGATDWLVATLIPDISNSPAAIVFLVCAVFVAVCHMAIPAGSAVLTLCAVPIIGIAASTGLNPGALMMITAFWSGAVFLFPFDGVLLLSYGYGYYKMTDMVKTGVIPYLTLIPLTAFILPFLMNLFGFCSPVS